MTPKTSSTPISQERAILMSLPDEDIRKLLDYGRALSQARMTVSKNSPYKQLMDAIGLDNLKETVKAIISSHKMSFLLKAKGRPYLPPHNHLSFVGNPGTFKTGAGKLFADIMFEEGVLPTNRFIYKTRSLLVGMYMGETALLVKKAIDEAEGGVLFIDEAYSLVEDDSRKAYGDE